jgi:hypothetical protein
MTIPSMLAWPRHERIASGFGYIAPVREAVGVPSAV